MITTDILDKEIPGMQLIEESKVFSTRNIIPAGRQVTNKDVLAFIDRIKSKKPGRQKAQDK